MVTGERLVFMVFMYCVIIWFIYKNKTTSNLKKRIKNSIQKFKNFAKNKSQTAFTPALNQETFENLLKDFAKELLFFYYLFPDDISNDTVYQNILYSTQEQPGKPISIILDNIDIVTACTLCVHSASDYWRFVSDLITELLSQI